MVHLMDLLLSGMHWSEVHLVHCDSTVSSQEPIEGDSVGSLLRANAMGHVPATVTVSGY